MAVPPWRWALCGSAVRFGLCIAACTDCFCPVTSCPTLSCKPSHWHSPLQPADCSPHLVSRCRGSIHAVHATRSSADAGWRASLAEGQRCCPLLPAGHRYYIYSSNASLVWLPDGCERHPPAPPPLPPPLTRLPACCAPAAGTPAFAALFPAQKHPTDSSRPTDSSPHQRCSEASSCSSHGAGDQPAIRLAEAVPGGPRGGGGPLVSHRLATRGAAARAGGGWSGEVGAGGWLP